MFLGPAVSAGVTEAGAALARHLHLPAEGSRRLTRIEALFSSPPAPAGAEREDAIADE